jgi:hypothetical protein
MASTRKPPTPAYPSRSRRPSAVRVPNVAQDIAKGTKQLIDQGKVAVERVKEAGKKIRKHVSK